MELNELCINCFRHTGGEDVCMNCGTVQMSRPKQPYQLFPHTILKGKFIIGKVINNGGMGIIYKAYDMQHESIVAIKEFLPTQNSMVNRIPGTTQVSLINENDREAYEQAKKKFIEEAQIISNCGSESIVTIKESFEENDTAYVVMEYLDGISLREFLSMNDGGMDFDTAMSIITPVADALSVMHKNGYIHCNVCPDNIFVCVNQHVKLIDFSGAKKAGAFTQDEKSIVTKPGYTPVEQYTSTGKIGTYTDIYALGAVFYNIVSGKTPVESIVRDEKDTLQKLTKLGIDIPVYADKATMRAMALRPEIRFKNVDDFLLALQGKKKARSPEEEEKLRKLKRNLSITAIFVFMLLSVVAAYTIKSVSSIIPTSSTEIELWYVESDNEKINKRWEKLPDEYKDFVKRESLLFSADIELKTKGFSSEKEYKQALEKAFEKGEAPDIYQSDMLKKDKNAADLEKLYKELDDEEFNGAYKSMKDIYADKNKIAFCYDMPVLYSYTSSITPTYANGKETLSELMNYKDEKLDFEHSLVTNPKAVLYAAYCYGYDGKQNKSVVTDLYNSAHNFENGKWEKSGDIFMSKDKQTGLNTSDSKFYIGMFSEYSLLDSSSCKVRTLTGKNTGTYYVFDEVWSVNKNSEKKDVKAAIFLMYYLINNTDGQELITKGSGGLFYLPLKKEVEDSMKNRVSGVFSSKDKKEYQLSYDGIFADNKKTSEIVKLAKKYDSTEDQLKEILK